MLVAWSIEGEAACCIGEEAACCIGEEAACRIGEEAACRIEENGQIAAEMFAGEAYRAEGKRGPFASLSDCRHAMVAERRALRSESEG